MPAESSVCQTCGTVKVIEPSVPVIHTLRTGPAIEPEPQRPQDSSPPVTAPPTSTGPPQSKFATTASFGTPLSGGAPPIGMAAPYPTPELEPSADPGRHRGTRIAIAVVALVIVIAGIAGAVIVMTGSGSDSTDVATQATTDATRDTVHAADEVGRTSAESKSAAVEAPAISPPPTTVAPKPGQVRLGPGVDDPTGATRTVQDLATALAHGDWSRARAIRPGLSGDDAALESGYAALNESTVIVSYAAPDSTGVDGAYLAWETTDSGEQTSIYCRHWTLTNAGTTVTDEVGGTSMQAHWPRWVDPSEVTDEVIGLCS